ncbi:hypothetical protein ISN45_Aa04g004580, partial [Arabidopsis thaliana x Arabidopsis arenosa]
MKPDWSLLPEELLRIVSKNVEDCFDVVHARSVCNSWRSTFPFPSCLLRPSYSLPTFDEFTLESKDLCTLEKVPLFVFRIKTPAASTSPFEYFLGGIGRDDRMDLPSPLQCSVKVEIPGYDSTLMNMVDCQILSLGHQYRLVGWEPKDYRGVAFLPLKMKWKRLENVPYAICSDLVTFRGRFYASFLSRNTFVIDPYSLEVTILNFDIIDFSRFTCIVSRLDEEGGKWVEVTDLGNRVFFIGHFGNVSCSAKELPDGCGLSGNSILFTNEPIFAYKYGVNTGSWFCFYYITNKL